MIKKSWLLVASAGFFFGVTLLRGSAFIPHAGTKRVDRQELQKLFGQVRAAFHKLDPQVIRPASGFIPHDYLVPGGYYTDMYDWDGFFIGSYLASKGPTQARYLQWWVLNFVKGVDKDGYVADRITPKGPKPISGKFIMKPFLSQGTLIASESLGDFGWVRPIYAKLQQVIRYREKTQLDPKYGLFYWNNAIESGVDDNVALSNDPKKLNSLIGVDMNTWQLREYLAMSKIAEALGKPKDMAYYHHKAAALQTHIQRFLWFPQNDSYFNIHRENGKPIKRITFSNFVPLVQSLAPRNDGRRMIEKYLWNRQYMLSDYGLRSLAKNDPAYNNRNIIVPYSNWRGPIWIVANYLYWVALRNYGFEQEANELSAMMAKIVLKDIRANGSMHEDYNAETGEPLAPTAEDSGGVFRGFVGWNLLVADMLKVDVSSGKPCISLN